MNEGDDEGDGGGGGGEGGSAYPEKTSNDEVYSEIRCLDGPE